MSANRDEYKVDWRAPRKPMAVRRSARMLRTRIADVVVRILEPFRAIPGGEPSSWHDVAVFLVGSAWGVVLTMGLLLAIAARHMS